MKRDWAKIGVVTLAVTVATVTGAGAQERMRPASIGAFGWTFARPPLKCDLTAEFATGALLGPMRGARRAEDARHRLGDTADIPIEEWNNGFQKQSADRMGSVTAFDALSLFGGQQANGRIPRVSDHER